MADRLGWAILGTGRIARKLAAAVNASSTGTLVAVGSRTQESADKFGDEFGVPAGKRYGSYEAVLSDPAVQAVYISLPNHLHAPWTIRCAEAGKHVLCEKPLAMNHAEAMVMVEACRKHGVFLMEAFMYRCHPQTARIAELVRGGAIGEVRVIQANFGFNAGDNWQDIRTVNAWGGGGIMDVGCYTASMARLIAGAAASGGAKPFEDPLDVKGSAHLGKENRIDEWALASVTFPGDVLANLACGVRVGLDNVVRVWGAKGSITIPSPWFAAEQGAQIIVHKAGEKDPQTVTVDGGAGLYTIEVDTVARAVAAGKQEADAPCMTWADSLSNMKTLDLWRKSVGLAWDTEKPEAMTTTFAGRPLARSADAKMKYARVHSVELPLSRIVMGTMAYRDSDPFTFAMLDDFFERGGNTLDLAWGYGGGECEKYVGRWIKARNLRKELVLLDKGAHPPFTKPEHVARQLAESLERLQVDDIDLYCLHRDNLEVPVGEWVDALEEARRAGRIRAYGGSNWSLPRIDEANAYAKRKGAQGFTINSPNLSLARWNQPMWGGCVTASDPDSRRWHRERQMPLFAWSSQASGFFSGRLTPEGANSPDWYTRDAVRTWLNPENERRLERARELGRKKGVDAVQIAMAWVLNQPFPTFALIGPRTIDETRTSLQGVAVELTPDEVKWLNLEA